MRLGHLEDQPYLARQQRLTFARCGIVDPLSVEDYEAHGGYAGLRRALSLEPQAIVDEIKLSGLRGRGGAGFPTGIKWDTVLHAQADRKYVVCNADEGDSGTFGDRMLMEGDPFCLIEGMTIAGLAVGATKGFIYIRSEYPHAYRIMVEAIELATKAGYLGSSVMGSGQAFTLEARLGAGAYICGEETSLLDSLEGKRGMVRAKPPLPAITGLFGKPTLINNTLSLATVPWILANGAQAYADFGMGRSRGTLPVQLAGNIKRGGLIEFAFGVTLREIIEDFGGGTATGRPVKAVQVGGPLGAYFPASMLDLPMDYESTRRGEGAPRSRRHRRVRRYRRSLEASPLRLRVLRSRELRQVHAVPRRRGAWGRGHGPDHRRDRAREELRGSRGSLHPHDRRLALRHGRADARARNERA